MLVTSNYKKNDIIGLKLSTGEEVVARFDKFDSSTKDKTLEIVKPTVLTLNPQTGQAMLIPWLMSLDTQYRLSVSRTNSYMYKSPKVLQMFI